MPSESRSLPEQAIAALRRGNKVEAIKLTRAATAMGLKESKDAVEAFLAGDETGVRQAFETARPQRSSLTLLVSLILVLLAIYWVFFRG